MGGRSWSPQVYGWSNVSFAASNSSRIVSGALPSQRYYLYVGDDGKDLLFMLNWALAINKETLEPQCGLVGVHVVRRRVIGK